VRPQGVSDPSSPALDKCGECLPFHNYVLHSCAVRSQCIKCPVFFISVLSAVRKISCACLETDKTPLIHKINVWHLVGHSRSTNISYLQENMIRHAAEVSDGAFYLQYLPHLGNHGCTQLFRILRNNKLPDFTLVPVLKVHFATGLEL
jgi:hypothetical protein